MEILKEWSTVLLVAISAVIWAVRVEAGMKSNKREIDDLKERRKEDLNNANSARDETNTILRELRGDIKFLLKSLATK